MRGKRQPAEQERPQVAGTAGLAAHLGLSRWTISRVLNGHDGVKEATRERVQQAMQELGFEPNRFARGLRGMPSGLVGISIPHLEAMVLARKTQALSRELRQAGYRGIFEMPEGDNEMEEEVVRHFLSIQVEGIILVGSRLTGGEAFFAEAKQKKVGIVALDPVNDLPVPTLRLNRGEAMAGIVGHLYENGHRRFGLLGIGTDDLYGDARQLGLQAGAARCGLDAKGAFMAFDAQGYSLQDYQYGAYLAEVLLREAEGITALICLNDRIAIGAMRTLQANGIEVPAQMAVVGFDNAMEGAWSHPSLSSVDQNIDAMMKRAVERLIAGESASSEAVEWVEPVFKWRASSAMALN